MLDIKLIRQDAAAVEKELRKRDSELSLKHVVTLDKRAREVQVEADELKSKRNALSKQIGELKRSGGDPSAVMAEVAGISDQAKVLDHELRSLEEELQAALAVLPNLPLSEIKVAEDPAENELVKSVGEMPTFDFEPKNHVELNEGLGIFDFKRGAKITGTGWPVYKGLGARLEWALLQYMIATHVANGFEQWMVPHVVKPATMYGAGQLPKFADQSFVLDDDEYPFYLTATAEIPLNGLFMDEILDEAELPKRMVAYTPCFRREAGAAGSQERGLIRVHQFNKVEMFAICKPEDSPAIFEEIVASASQIVEGLGLHYRQMKLVTGDTGFQAAKTIDVEVYLPGQKRYYEVSSVSTCTDFQARRSQIRFRREGGKPELVHTLNGSGVATSRLMVALLENNQQADGSVLIPEVLRPYLGGVSEVR